MSLRRRLVLWYGVALAVVLVAALIIAYDLHAESHDADVEAALTALVDRAESDVQKELASGIPLAATDLTLMHRAIDEPNAVWLVVAGRIVASAGAADDPAFVGAALTTLPEGWHTAYTVDGRVRSFGRSVGYAQIVAAANLSTIDRANADLRTAYLILGVLGIAIGSAVFSSVTGVALRPVMTLTDAASEIATSRDFRRRVRIDGDKSDELVVLADTFDEMLTSLDDAYRQQQRFLSDVSHELRTPLTSIRGHAELLASGGLAPDAERDAAHSIERESARLGRLVDELLLLARSEAAETFAPREVHLDEVVMETFAELRALSEGRLRVRAMEAARVKGERDRLKQVVLALVDNALRYTPPPGRVDVTLRVDGADAVLRVEDEGIGIDDEDLPHVFERFYRGAAARRVSTGSGLGLAIVRWIVDRHGGSVRLERGRDGRGTVAVVRLPLLSAANEPQRVAV